MVLLVLFAHLIGVGVFGGAATLETLAFGRIRRATDTAEIRSAVVAAKPVAALFPAATLILVVTGAALMWFEGRDWRTPWLLAAFVLIVAAALVGKLVIGARVGALAAAAFRSESTAVAPDVDAIRRDPVLQAGSVFSTAAGVALIFLMTTKPNAPAAVATVLATVVVALAAWALAVPARVLGARAVR